MIIQNNEGAASSRGGYTYMELLSEFELNDKDQTFMDEGACYGMGSDKFFAHKGRNDLVADAKKICAGCPVRVRCLNFALNNNIVHGVWGGTSGIERLRYLQGHLRLVTV